MEEKTIIKSENKSFLGVALGGTIVAIILFFIPIIEVSSHPPFAGKGISYNLGYNSLDDILWPIALVVLLLVWVVYFMVAKNEITVTDKRIFGKAAFGKRVDLPLDSISAVGMGLLSSISIASSSGSIRFSLIKNRDEIHNAISKLLVERQGKEKQATTTTIKQEIPQSNADELKKYKDLLDSGVITQEEFDAKKKQLLGL